MSDKYNHWIGKLFGFFNRKKLFAVTFNQTAYYSCYYSQVNSRWRAHEDKHKEQWKKYGRVKFLILYLWYLLLYGYQNNPFEIEAKSAEGER